ncbi:MAG: hypothetical protein K8R59_00865 [Thermoanaerobaculales bacterium]|nr:hypothetical protein [Thermoanaerobaculales bacterium]
MFTSVHSKRNDNAVRCALTHVLGLMIVICLCSGTVPAQTWTTYTETSFVGGIAADGNDVWAGTDGGLLHWDIASATYQKYTTSEGLADQWVKDVLIDSVGDLWIGTKAGVQHFDGTTWTTYDTSNSPLPNDIVYAITEDLDGDMWFGTAYGCAELSGASWTVFTDLGGGATNVAVRGIDVDSSNQIWTANNPSDYGDPGGVSMYDGATWTRLDPDPDSIGQYFLSLIVDDSDNVWAGSWTNWVFVYDGAVWAHYDSANSELVGKNIEAFEVDSSGTVWIGNHESFGSPAPQGMTTFDGSTWTTYTPANSGLPESFVYSISSTGANLYFGTGGMWTAGFDGTTWEYFEPSNEPHCNWITAIDEGEVGALPSALYFGTEFYGVAVLSGGAWSSYWTGNSGLGDNSVNDVHVDDGTLWVGCQYSGLWEYDGTTWVGYDPSNSDLLGDIVLSVDTDSTGVVWLGNAGWDGPYEQNGAVARFDGASWTSYYLANSSLIDDDNLHVRVAPDDTIWIGTEEGISHFDGVSSWTNYDTTNSGLVEDHVQAIAFDSSDGKWFGTRGGISYLDGTGAWTSYTTADGLPSNEIRDIAIADSGEVWVATNAGAAVLNGSSWTAVTQTDGLADNDVTAIASGSDGLLWFGTDRSGISARTEASGLIFADGFESGNFNEWSTTAP